MVKLVVTYAIKPLDEVPYFIIPRMGRECEAMMDEKVTLVHVDRQGIGIDLWLRPAVEC